MTADEPSSAGGSSSEPVTDPSDASQIVQRRVDQILFSRLRFACMATLVVQSISIVINYSLGEVRTAMAAFASALACALALRAMQRNQIPERLAGALLFALWLLILAGLLVAFTEVGLTVVSLWTAMLIIGHSFVQLRPLFIWLAIVLGCAVWLGAVYLVQPYNSVLHLLSAAIAVAISFVAFRTNRDLIERLEWLKDVDEKRRQQLALALTAARRELNERRQAEHESEQLREQFIQSQRLEAIGNLAGGVAHDMNNVLSSISTVTALINESGDDRHRNDLAVIREACERGASLTNSLLGFSRRAQYRKERLPLSTAANDAVRLLARTLRKEVRLLFDPGDRSYWVDADRNHLVQVILNLCINSEHAIAGAGTIRIELGQQIVDEPQARELGVAAGPYATLAVLDNGCGMDQETRRRAFEPFFTTQAIGKGSGLGLAMAYGTLRAHDGAIRITSELSSGTTAMCLLPLQPDGPAPEPASAQRFEFDVVPDTGATLVRPPMTLAPMTLAPMTMPPVLDAGDAHAKVPFEPIQRVLLIDDERLVRYSMVRSLEHKGYGVLTAENGEDGLKVFSLHRNAVDVVVLDMSMPGMNGAQCYQHLRALDAQIPIICISGYPLDTATGELMGSDVFALEKPFRIEQLIAQIKSATASRVRPA